MIYVLEVPAQGLPKAWFAYDDEDFSRKVAASDPLQPWEIYDEVTPRGLLEALGACRASGVESENAPRRGQFLPDSPPHSGTMGQEAGKKWAAAAHSQPTIPKSDRLLGHDATSAQARAHYPALCALGDEHGFDTPLYRADYLLGRGVLRAEPVSARAALAAALSARAGLHCVYWDERAAISAFEGADPRIAGPAHWHARRALYEQLVALEVLADDN